MFLWGLLYIGKTCCLTGYANKQFELYLYYEYDVMLRIYVAIQMRIYVWLAVSFIDMLSIYVRYLH